MSNHSSSAVLPAFSNSSESPRPVRRLLRMNQSFCGEREGSASLAKELLDSLSDVDREALVRFYGERQDESEIEKSLNLPSGHVAMLRRTARTRFLARIRETDAQAPIG